MTNTKSNRFKIFLEFLIFGVILGLIENLIVIKLATQHLINFNALLISFLVVIPFAILGEVIVDRIKLIPKTKNKYLKAFEIFLEFLVFGIIMGVVEDLVVINILTKELITLETVKIVTIITLPFAFIGEVVVDRADWLSWLTNKK